MESILQPSVTATRPTSAGLLETSKLKAVARPDLDDADARLEQFRALVKIKRKAQWRIDFVAAENAMGFHAPQEASRILGEAIYDARQGQVAANSLVR